MFARLPFSPEAYWLLDIGVSSILMLYVVARCAVGNSEVHVLRVSRGTYCGRLMAQLYKSRFREHPLAYQNGRDRAEYVDVPAQELDIGPGLFPPRFFLIAESLFSQRAVSVASR